MVFTVVTGEKITEKPQTHCGHVPAASGDVLPQQITRLRTLFPEARVEANDEVRADPSKHLDLAADALLVCRDRTLDDTAANLALQCRLRTI